MLRWDLRGGDEFVLMTCAQAWSWVALKPQRHFPSAVQNSILEAVFVRDSRNGGVSTSRLASTEETRQRLFHTPLLRFSSDLYSSPSSHGPPSLVWTAAAALDTVSSSAKSEFISVCAR